MTRHRILFSLLIALAAGACGDSTSVAPETSLDEQAFEVIAEAALEMNDAQGVPLPSLNNLLRRTYHAIRTQDGHEQGVRLLRAGKTLQGIIAVLGTSVAGEAMAGVNQAIARLEDRIEGKSVPDRVRRIMARAKELAARGQYALDEQHYAAALGAALAAADVIRSLSPRYQARKAIERANRAFNAARNAVAGSATPDEITALRQAHRALNAAREAFKAKEYRKAWNYAHRSMGLSLGVLNGRLGP
jgi:hypothetical protein